jgi:hypothetical protein
VAAVVRVDAEQDSLEWRKREEGITRTVSRRGRGEMARWVMVECGEERVDE